MTTSAEPVEELAGQRERLERNVFLTQLLLSVAVLILVCVVIVLNPQTASSPLFLVGTGIVFVSTVLSAVIPWGVVPRASVIILPLLDLIALAFLREGEPALGASLFMVFPIIWMSTYFGFLAAALGPLAASIYLWMSAALSPGELEVNDLPRLLVLPITFFFVSTTAYLTAKRSRAQRTLLRQQALLLEDALARARRDKRTLDEVLNAVNFGVVGFDDVGRVAISNEPYRRLLDQYGALEGTSFISNLYDEDRTTPLTAEQRPSTRAMRGETFDNVTVWMASSDSPSTAHSFSGRQLVNEKGERDGSVIVSRDVTTELKAIKARDDLVASVSHELRTPLTSILGYLELVLDSESVDEDSRAMIEVALNNADRMLALVADLLTTAADSEHLYLLTFSRTDLNQVVEQSLEGLRPAASERGITLETVADPGIVLQADGFRLRQVIDNLVSNAIKYNTENGIVMVSISETDDTVTLRVADTGIGMSAEEQKGLFEKFYRADSVRQSSVHGTGLGLNITRNIIEQHNGQVQVESIPGEGTTIVVTLPRQAAMGA